MHIYTHIHTYIYPHTPSHHYKFISSIHTCIHTHTLTSEQPSKDTGHKLLLRSVWVPLLGAGFQVPLASHSAFKKNSEQSQSRSCLMPAATALNDISVPATSEKVGGGQ